MKLKVVRSGIYRVGERGNSVMKGWVSEGNGLNLNGEIGGVYDGWMWVVKINLGKSVMERCEEERIRGGVGGGSCGVHRS